MALRSAFVEKASLRFTLRATIAVKLGVEGLPNPADSRPRGLILHPR
jgi:hypothetical protein